MTTDVMATNHESQLTSPTSVFTSVPVTTVAPHAGELASVVSNMLAISATMPGARSRRNTPMTAKIRAFLAVVDLPGSPAEIRNINPTTSIMSTATGGKTVSEMKLVTRHTRSENVWVAVGGANVVSTRITPALGVRGPAAAPGGVRCDVACVNPAGTTNAPSTRREKMILNLYVFGFMRLYIQYRTGDSHNAK